MKSTLGKIIALLVIVAVPMFVWGTMTQRLEVRQFATDDGITPSVTPSTTPTPSLTPTPANKEPLCNGLSVSPSSGSKPLTVTFVCSGSDPDNDMTAAEFDFGETTKQTIEKNISQFGSITTIHAYNTVGTYSVTCRLRDNNQKFSSIPDQCKKSVSVSAPTTPAPTKIPNIGGNNDGPIIFVGNQQATTPAEVIPTPTNTPIPTPTLAPVKPTADYSLFFQLGTMFLVSAITIIVGLLLRRAIGGPDA